LTRLPALRTCLPSLPVLRLRPSSACSANDIAKAAKRSSLSGADVIRALSEVDMPEFADAAGDYLAAFKGQGAKARATKAAAKRKAAAATAVVADDDDGGGGGDAGPAGSDDDGSGGKRQRTAAAGGDDHDDANDAAGGAADGDDNR
jgi:hypothetical protein